MKSKLLAFFKKYLKLVKALTITHLPVGMTEFDSWAADIISLSEIPDNDSTRFALATMILHLPPQAFFRAKLYFVLSLNKGAANQIASGIMHELKEKQKAAQEAAAKAASEQPTS